MIFPFDSDFENENKTLPKRNLFGAPIINEALKESFVFPVKELNFGKTNKCDSNEEVDRSIPSNRGPAFTII